MRTLLSAILWGLLLSTAVYAGDDSETLEAAQGLIRRILPHDAPKFTVEHITAENGKDVFEIEGRDGRITIRGNTAVSMAMGLNWYLKHYCRCHVSWCGIQLNLPEPLPDVWPKVRRVSWARYRYFLNYCCFGYSLPWWDWDQWQELIDWMALNGINAPLSVTGQEAVWQAVCRQLGMNDEQIRQFLAGPPFLPFQWMGCLDGWGGPLSENWIDRHEELEKKILKRQRELGMTPVLQGFTGHVPSAVAEKFPDAKLHCIAWIEWNTRLLDPLDPLFPKIARLFLEEQTKRFGTDHLYAADTFIEMTPPSGETEYLRRLSRAIYDGMAGSDPHAVWILQGWAFMFKRSFWTQPRIRAFLEPIPDDRMLVLDLFCEGTPMWNRTEAFCGKPWAWCNVQNFGCKVHLGGKLSGIASRLPAARQDPNRGKLVGLGFVNEGLDYNPIVWDLMFEMAWRGEGPIDLNSWCRNYARHRYGAANEKAERAWRILKETIYVAPWRTRSIIDHVPRLEPVKALPYDNYRVGQAWRLFLDAAQELGDRDTYRFDLVNVARQALSNHAAELHREVTRAYQAKDAAGFSKVSKRFLQIFRDLDALVATRKEFLLGRWLEDAKRWGTTDAERVTFEWNARRVLTLWGQTERIDDYACKEWSGMIRGYYLKRWEAYLDELNLALNVDRPFNESEFSRKQREWMAAWSDAREVYPVEPQGDSIELARKLWDKYGGAFNADAFKPDAPSLTTNRPVTCSDALPRYPAFLANDGRAQNTNRFWAMKAERGKPPWWQVDLEEPTTVGRVVVVGYFGDRRYYGFTVETSLDGKQWRTVVDRSDNKEPSTAKGYTCRFNPRPVRYIRVTMMHNSANIARHLVEVMAFAK